MARTKASVGSKVSSGKSSKARCSVAPPSSSSSSSGSSDKGTRSYSGGNSVCQRETPKWQKPITNFFICKDGPDKSESHSDEDGETAGTSKSKPKRNVIHSDDEDEQLTNGEDEQTPLENGEDDPNVTENGERKPTESNILTNGETDKPKNHVLDETLELEPLDGENSHKIEEYYSKNSKGKGVGKKTKGKENLDANMERRNSLKRDLDEVTIGEDNGQPSKKIKVN